MAKKSSFLRNLKRSRKTTPKTLRVESLESRQLYAVVTGSGTEVVTDQTNSDGVTYDQILMTGSSVSVTNDVGQVTRVSFLDNDGDIVQVAIVGNGTLNVSLDGATTGVAPSNYNAAAQAYKYTQGNATITITGSDAGTSMEVYSVGAARNPGVVDATHQGGDHWADIQRIIIVGNEKNEAGYTNFGSIRAGNAYFSADTGVVGIRGENVAVQGAVRIGDIDATGSGVPTLYFNSNSQFQTVFVQGGDLEQSNGTSFNSFGNGNAGGTGNDSSAGGVSLGGFAYFNSIMGMDSQGNYLMATPVNQDAIRLAAVDQQTLMSGDWVFTLGASGQVTSILQNGVDVTTGILQGATGAQNTLDAAFDRRTFTGDITINGDLPAGLEINVADARGDVTFANDLFGSFVVDGFGASIDGTLTVMGNLDGHVLVRGLDRVAIATNAMLAQGQATYNVGDAQINKINAIVVEGSTGEFADVRAEEIGNVLVRHNFSGLLSTNVWSAGANTGNLALPGVGGTDWNSVARTATGYVDFDGKIGNITIGQKADGTSNGGSLINGTIQGMSGIGNVWVGGDVWGSAPGNAVFVTSSNAGAAATDVRNYGSANIGNITVHGDVDLDTASNRLIYIAGNGTFGNITVEGQQTTDVVQVYTHSTFDNVFIPGSETFIRILSPFTDVGFVPNAAAGEAVIQNYDPDAAGPLNSDYLVTAADVTAGAKIYTINNDGTLGALVNAQAGDRVPVVNGGVPVKDALGNVLYYQNTALFKGEFELVETKHYDTQVTVLSGNRGNLDGIYNNFGRIEIAGLLGAQQATTGAITWTDSVDMNFGGITVNSSGLQNAGVVGQLGTIGQITINNASGATSNLVLSGAIGAVNTGSTNDTVAFASLAGLAVDNFEEVAVNGAITAAKITNGIDISTVAGVGNGTGAGTVSPTVTFNSLITLNNGTVEGAQNALLAVNTGTVNSTITFTQNSGIVVDNGGNTGNIGSIDDLSLAADYINFDGKLSAQTIGDITLVGGSGIGSTTDTAVNFVADIVADTVGNVAISASAGNVVFAPDSINASSQQGDGSALVVKTTVGNVVLSTAGTNNGGDISFGQNGETYDADFGNVTLTAGHKLFLSQAGTIVDNPGNIAINFATTGNVGNVVASTTTGTITNALVVQGNVGDITYSTGAAVVANSDEYAGAVGDLVRAGSIVANQTIWGTRGVTTMTTAGNDGSTVDFTVAGVDYKILAGGTINATLNYAGASTATGNAFIAKTGSGAATVAYNVIGNDDNADGVIAISEIGHGGNAMVSSVSGDISFAGGTQLTDYTHVATLGNVELTTGTHPQASGLITGAEKGDITLSFNDLAGAPATGGFEGKVGNIAATTTGGNITFAGSRFDNTVGNVTLTTGAVAHTGGVEVGDIVANVDGGVIFNGGQGLVKATAIDVGTIAVQFTSNGTSATGYELTTQYGALTANIGAGSYDANNNGLITANEYGRTGDLALTSSGAPIALTLSSTAYNSVLEQSMIGNVTLTNSAFIGVKDGAADILGDGTSALGSVIAGANGNITVTGNSTGKVGNIVATTNTGTITQNGVYGDLGTTTFTTTSYFDTDTDPNTTAEAPVLRGDGDIALAATVNGAHGLATYSVKEAGTISGNLTFGGQASSANSIVATSERGDITLGITLQDWDRDGSNHITNLASNPEFGTVGTSSFTTTSGGDVSLTLATTQNDTEVDDPARSLVPEFTFGAITVNVADRYASTSATKADVLAKDVDTPADWDTGNISINGTGENIDTGAGVFAVNRGTIDSITANVTRGNIVLNGNFGKVGAQNLTATAYADVLSAANTDAIVGNINYSPNIWGEHGTATLRIVDTGATGTGVITTGNITGTATFGGDIVTGSTVSVDAMNGRGNITLDVLAKGYDLNQDGFVTDGDANNIPAANEFAKVGAIKAETTNAGDINLGIGINTYDGSTLGSVIGNITAIANDDIYNEVANKADTATDLGNVTVTGKSALPITAGTVGNITMEVDTGIANLTGNFVNIGSVTMTTGLHTDVSNAAGKSVVDAAGNIQLGTQAYGAAVNADTAGFTSLNIAGSYGDSTLTVAEMGTITGAVYVAGTASSNNWTLNADYGVINVGYVAGFDANGAGGVTATEAGKIGNITATSNHSNVTIAVGGRAADSVVGNVSVTTGDVLTQIADKADTIESNNTTITGISGGGLGSVGNLTASVKTGVATLDGTFGGIGNVTYTTDAVIDTDPTAAATENAVLWASGEIALNAAVWGSHGTLNLTTIDTSKIAAMNDVTALVAPQTSVETLNKVAGTVTDTGDITGNIAFSGGLNSGVTDGIVAKTDRGNVTLTITSGIDEDGATDQDSNEAGSVGNVSFTSIDGDLTANLNVRNSISSIGNVTLNTGATFNTNEELADAQIAAGDATITSNNVGANGNYGTIGNILVNTTVGDITFNGVYNNLGTVTLDGGRQTDADTVAGSGEPLAILDAGDITVNTTIRGASGMFTLDTDDNATAGAAAGVTGDITATIVVDGTLTNGVLATTDQGTINATITAGTSVKLVDAIANVTADNAATNSDDRVGAVGNVVLTSVYGDITSTNNTAVVAIVPASTDAIRYSSIGNVTATTGGSWAAQAALNDTLVIDGDITFAGTSNGTIGNIAGTTSTGDIAFAGTYNHTVGNITLTAGFYTDTDPAVAGVDILGAGSIAFGGAFANNAAITANTVGNITLSASGAVSNAGDQTGNITVTRSIGGAWTDAGVIGDIEAGEQVTYDDGAFLATVVDGTITFNETADATGFGAKFDNVTLKSTGGSNEAGTGNITVGGGGSYSQVSNVLVEAATGDVTFAGAYVAPTISSVTLYSKAGNGVSGNGSVDFQAAGKLDLGFQNAIDNRAVNVSTSNVTIKADNGNVTVAGSIGEQLTYTATNYAVAGGVVTDARTATISGITLTANNGLVNDGAADGALLISGEIGGEDITRIADITAGAGNVAGDGTTISGSVNAHDIGTLAFTGNLSLTVAGAISASDAATTRQYIGAIDYTAMTTGAAANKGSLLDIIDSITVTNGSVTGAAGVTYVGNNRGEIEASKITAISFINNVNPSVGPAYTVQDLDVLASNSRGGISQGEFLNVNGVAAADAASAITAFGLGNVTIQFNVTNTDDAGGLFAGNSAFVGLGGIGNIALTTSTNGATPRPMFAAAAGAGVRFAAGTGIAYGANFDLDGDIVTPAAAYDDVAAAGVGDKISVGDIYVKVGRSLPANIADPLMANIGGDNTVTTDGFGVLVAAQAPAAADTASARVAAATELYGYIKSVDVSTTSTRVDADGTQFVAAAGLALPAAPAAGDGDAGAFIAVAGDATAAHDIGNLDNDFVPNGDAPVDDTQGFVLGDTDTAYEQGEVVVYVL